MFKIGLFKTIFMLGSFPHVTAAIKYDKEAEAAALELNRVKWSTYSGGTSNYEFKMERICYCPIEYRGPFNIEVRLGQIVSATYESGKRADSDIVQGLPTIEGVFGQIEKALELGYDDLKVTYDDEGGFPTSLWYDMSSMIADDEITFLVSSVQLLPSLDL